MVHMQAGSEEFARTAPRRMDVRTADDDSGPVPHEAFKLPRALLNWGTPARRSLAGRRQRYELDPDRTPVTRRDPLDGARAQLRAPTDAFDDEPTTAIPTPILPRPILPRTPERPDAPRVLRGAGQLGTALARAAQLWRDRPLRTAAIMAGAALLTYLAVADARHRSSGDSQMLLAPVVVLPAAAPIIVEQLNEARELPETGAPPLRGKQTDKPGRRSAGRRARETPFALAAVSESGDQPIAPAQSKSQRAEPSSTTMSSSSAELPAWNAEAVRDFSGAKPAEPPDPEPVAPPPPSKPLTMEQMLNQVEEAAQAQRRQAGLKAPKTSQRDAELDELINGAMTSKKK
jgi:hypothetical protein